MPASPAGPCGASLRAGKLALIASPTSFPFLLPFPFLYLPALEIGAGLGRGGALDHGKGRGLPFLFGMGGHKKTPPFRVGESPICLGFSRIQPKG
jgi:hypothetical protein